jgi:hypothetical protein
MKSQKLHWSRSFDATAAIAHSQIVVTLAVAQRFLPVGFDDQDVAILQWIAAEGRHAKRSYL